MEPEKGEKQESAEADVDHFRKHLGPFVVAAETTRMAMVFTNAKVPSSPIIFANDSFLRLIGYDRGEVLGQAFDALMERGTAPESLAQVKAAFEGTSDTDPEICYRRKDGSDFWASLFISPVRDDSGDVVQHFVSLIDLTRHIEEKSHAKMLIDELNHRVKNTLATVKSIVSQALRNSPDPSIMRESIESRLSALSGSHNLLTRENWKRAALTDVVQQAMKPFGIADGRAERFLITGENVYLPPKPVLALGIALHELATNAVKYGAFSNDTGSVLIWWTVEAKSDGDRLRLRWEEKDGPPVVPPSRRGFGSRVIEQGLAYELGGTVDLKYQQGGVVCTIDFPSPQGGTRDE
ncbi:MAG: HWE histidine kinase domain-containing protein [Janthinobacterium lividum]